MGKRQRTPHFVTGLGDGHVGGTTADSSKVANKKALHLTGLRHPTAKVHAAAATDDIFRVTEHVRRNNNNNNRNPRLRSAAATTNERLARMDMDDGRESRWDMMFTSSSGDGKHSHRHGKAGNSRGIGNNNPLLHPTEQWQMSAIALVCMLVFLSALFLHMVSSDTSSTHGSSGSADLNSKNHRRIPRRRDNKRKVSLGTRKKDERYWSSDEYEEGSEVDNHNATDSGVLIPRGVVTVDSDGGQASTAALTPNNTSGSNKTVLHYPYQPRHRKPSVTGHKETFAAGGAATSYSPAAKPRNYYHLNPMDGPVVPSYQTPVAAKARLHVGGNTTTAAPAATATAASPSHLAYPATPSQQHQQSPYLQQSPYNGSTPKARTSNPMMSPGRSPAAAKNTIAASTLDTSNEFIATGLESFHPNPPVNDATANGVGTTTPQVQRKPHQTLFSTPARATNNMDEDCQKQHSTTSATSSPHIPHLHSSAAMNSPTANTDTMHRYNNNNNNNNNNGPAYGQSMSFEVVSGNNISSTSNTNSQPQQFQNQQHQSFSNQYSGGTPGNSMGYGILSPRVEADISDLEETPRAGFARRTVAIGDHHNYSTNPSLMMKQQQQQQEAYQVFSAAQKKPHQQYQQFQSSAGGSSSSNRDDPFQALRLPVVPAMGSTAQNRQQLGGTTPNFSIPHQPSGQQQQQQQRELQQNEFNMPFIPKLDLAVAAAMASSSQQQIMSNGAPGIAPPRSMSVEELHLVQMESGTHWKVNSGLTNENADVVTALPGGASDNNSNSKSRRKSTTNPFHASAGLGNSDELWSVASSSADDADDSGAADGPRNSIIHKRDNMTADTNAASSLRSSIKFDELKLDEVIGGGGFGQVWKADWRGTPVAVKVLTGSAQAKRVPKAILEEFAAEINLLSVSNAHFCICMALLACRKYSLTLNYFSCAPYPYLSPTGNAASQCLFIHGRLRRPT